MMADRHASLINDTYAISEEAGDRPLKIKALVETHFADLRVTLRDDGARIREALSSLRTDLVIESTKPETPEAVRELLRAARDYAGTIQNLATID
jgi:hypothetical protein